MPLELITLSPTGWTQVVNGQLVPYANGVLTDQVNAQNILNNTAPTCASTIQGWFNFVLNRSADANSVLWYSKLFAYNGEASAHGDFLGGATTEVTNTVTGWYSTVLGRTPDAGGLSYWVDQVKSAGHNQSYAAFVAAAAISH